MLTKDENIFFLLNKIRDIRVALFRADIDSLLTLPVNIISTIKADCDGNIWFYTSCNGPFAKIIDKSFYATLEFYRKGKDYRMIITGKAAVDENEHGFTDPLASSSQHLALIKFKILKAEYFEIKELAHASLTQKITNFVSELFIPHTYRQFNFPETTT